MEPRWSRVYTSEGPRCPARSRLGSPFSPEGFVLWARCVANSLFLLFSIVCLFTEDLVGHPAGSRRPLNNFIAHEIFQTFFALIPQFRRGGGPIFGTKFDAPRLGRELKAPTLGIWLFVLLIALMRETDFEFPSGKKKGCSAPQMCVFMHTSKFKQDASVCVCV